MITQSNQEGYVVIVHHNEWNYDLHIYETIISYLGQYDNTTKSLLNAKIFASNEYAKAHIEYLKEELGVIEFSIKKINISLFD